MTKTQTKRLAQIEAKIDGSFNGRLALRPFERKYYYELLKLKNAYDSTLYIKSN